MKRGWVFAWGILLAVAATASGQQWAREMFDHTSYDFGTVARGAKAQHRFTLENIYEEDVHIASIDSSCGCTTPTATKKTLKTWEKADIVAEVDTRSFLGQKDATLTVHLDKPFPAEVRLNIHVYIRSDVVVQPGVVQFGSVSAGAGAEETVSVSYAGRSNWRIEQVESPNPHLEAEAVETSRTAGQVNYDLHVRLKPGAPTGYVREHLVLVTNDANTRSSRVPIAVEGVVSPSVEVRPSPLLLGVVQTGQIVTKRLVVKGAAPFHITGAECADPRFALTLPNDAKSVHLVQVTFTAGETPEKIDAPIRIKTDAASAQALTVRAHVRVIPPGPVSF